MKEEITISHVHVKFCMIVQIRPDEENLQYAKEWFHMSCKISQNCVTWCKEHFKHCKLRRMCKLILHKHMKFNMKLRNDLEAFPPTVVIHFEILTIMQKCWCLCKLAKACAKMCFWCQILYFFLIWKFLEDEQDVVKYPLDFRL